VHHNGLPDLFGGRLRDNSRPLGFLTPGEPRSYRHGYHIWGLPFRRFQAGAPKWAAKLPLEVTGRCQVRQLILVHAEICSLMIARNVLATRSGQPPAPATLPGPFF
jgi:hypothetical protein